MNAFKKLRLSQGWSIWQAAQRFFVSSRTFEGWEQGRKPSEAKIKLLLKLDKGLRKAAEAQNLRLEDFLKSE